MQRDRYWFIAQAANGLVAFLLDYLNQSMLSKTVPSDTQARLTSLGHLNAIGTLYIALAGLMNIVVMLDAFAGPDRDDDGPTAGGQIDDADRLLDSVRRANELMQSVWYASLVPLAIGIAMIYKAIRVTSTFDPTGPGMMLSVQIVCTIVLLLAIALIVFVQFIIPAA